MDAIIPENIPEVSGEGSSVDRMSVTSCCVWEGGFPIPKKFLTRSAKGTSSGGAADALPSKFVNIVVPLRAQNPQRFLVDGDEHVRVTSEKIATNGGN